MFDPKVKNCYVACSRDKIDQGLCECLNKVMNESGPHHGTKEFEHYLDVFCGELRLTRQDVYKNPAILETVWSIYQNIQNLNNGQESNQ